MCGSNRLRVPHDLIVNIDHGVPHDLIVNILEKLPIKCIVRFKYVSKQWFELITDTYFTYRHLSNQTKKDALFFSVRFTSIPVRYLSTSKRRLPMESMVVATDSTLSYSHTRMICHLGEDYCDMANSCDGILCFNGNKDVCVFNPATMEYRRLPFGPCRLVGNRMGFGRDLVTKRYKIVKIFLPSSSKTEEDDDSCAVFTLDPNPKACWKCWKIIGAVPYKINVLSRSAYVNGAIYWLTDEIRHLNKSEVIIMFDLHIEKFQPIPHPNHFSDKSRSNMQLVSLRECLCLVHKEPDYQLSIWMMMQQQITWEKLYCIQHPDLQIDLYHGHRFAFAEHIDGTLLICTKFRVYLHKQNDVIRCVPHKYAEHRYGPCVTTSFTESLVPVYGKTLSQFSPPLTLSPILKGPLPTSGEICWK